MHMLAGEGFLGMGLDEQGESAHPFASARIAMVDVRDVGAPLYLPYISPMSPLYLAPWSTCATWVRAPRRWLGLGLANPNRNLG